MGPKQPNLLFGAFICTLGYLCMALVGTCSKLLGKDVPIVLVLFIQNLICFILVLPYGLKKGFSHLKTKRIGLYLFRTVAGILTFFFLFLSLRTIPLVDGILLQNTAPLWIPLILLVGLRDKINPHLWWGVGLGFVGILLILKPGAAALSIGMVFGIISGFLLGIVLVSLRRLSLTEPTDRIMLLYFFIAMVCMLPFAIYQGSSSDFGEWYYLVGVGVFMFLTQMLITYSFKHGKASTFAPIAYTAVVFSGILGWLIWNHVPDLLSFIGLVFVIAGGLISLLVEKAHEKHHKNESGKK